MPKGPLIQANFTTGEISPRMYGRTDLDKYANAVKLAQNVQPLVHGGARRRAGSFFAQAAKFSTSQAILVPFVVDRTTAYMVEFGNLYARIFSPSGVYTGIELVSPYTPAQVLELDYCQGADTMFLFHKSVAPYRLRSFSSSNWDLSPVPFTVAPFDEQGHPQSVTLTLSATSGVITATAGAGTFLPSDVGRDIISNAGLATITAYTSATVVTATVVVTFSSVSIAALAWYLDFSPQGFIKPSIASPAGSTVALTGAVTRAATITLSAKTGALTLTASAGVFVPGDAGLSFFADNGVITTLGYTNATTLTGTTTADFLSLVYPQGSWGITGAVFRSEDVGKYIRMNGGLLKLASIPSSSSATATIVTALTSIIVAAPFAWSLEAAVWSATNGYPQTGCLHEQRLWAGGTSKYPQTLWGSRTGLYLDFTKGSTDTDAVSFTIASKELSPIVYLAAERVMMVLTSSREYSLQGSPGKAITPTSVQLKPETKKGTARVRPIFVDDLVLVQRAGRKVWGLAYEFASDRYVGADLTLLAEHITLTGITSFAYQQEPDQLLWFTLADGTLISCTYDRQQLVVAWSRHYTDGFYEWVASIPTGSTDQVWVIVRRIVNGVSVRYVEWLDHTYVATYPATVDPNAALPLTVAPVYGCMVDAGKSYANAVAQTVFTGLSHLEAKTVDVLADGAAFQQHIVAGGQITIETAAKQVLIGLPYKSKLTLLTPEIQSPGAATIQGAPMRTGYLTIRVYNSLAMVLEDDEGRQQTIPMRAFGAAALLNPPTPFTGNLIAGLNGWRLGSSEFSIEQNSPLPQHILAVIREFTANA